MSAAVPVQDPAKLFSATQSRIAAIFSGSDNEELRLESLLTLGKIGDPGALECLTRGVEEFPDNIEPLNALAYYRQSDALAFVLKLLEQPNRMFRDETVRILGEIASPLTTAKLEEFLLDEDRMVRYQAAWALFKTGGRNVAQIISRLLSDPDEWIVINVLEILSRLKNPEVVPALVGQFKIIRDARLKAIIISTLGTFGETQLLPIFEEGLKSFDTRIQANAVEAISQLKISPSEIKRRLKRFLVHPNNRIKANAAIALFASEPERVTAELHTMIELKDVPSRRSAAFVLSRISHPQKGVLIPCLLEDKAFNVRRMALKAAFSPLNEFHQAKLVPFFDDENQWVRKDAVDCAKRIPDFIHRTLIDLCKSEKSPPVVEALMDYFQEKGVEEAVPLIVQKIKDKPEEGLPALLRALGFFNKRDLLLECRKYLDASDTEIQQAFFISLLQTGELNVVKDLCGRILEKNRDDEQVMALRLVGEVGYFLRHPAQFSRYLRLALGDVAEAKSAAPGDEKPVSKATKRDLFREGVAHFTEGRLDEAYACMVDCLKADSKQVEALYYLAAILNKKGEIDSALPILKRLLKALPKHVEGLFLQGQMLFYRKEWAALTESYEHLQEILAADGAETGKMPTQILGALGVAYFHLKRYPRAVKVLNEALKMNPRDMSSSYHLALSHYAMKDSATALKILYELRKGLPADSRVLRNVDELLQKLEEEA